MSQNLGDYFAPSTLQMITDSLAEFGAVTLTGTGERPIVHEDSAGVDRLMDATNHKWAHQIQILVSPTDETLVFCEVYKVTVKGTGAFMTVVLDGDLLDSRVWNSYEQTYGYVEEIKQALLHEYEQGEWRIVQSPADIPDPGFP